jgi:hypothetical protein
VQEIVTETISANTLRHFSLLKKGYCNMACSGCKLSWSLEVTGSVRAGTFSISNGYGTSPTYNLYTTGISPVIWGRIAATVGPGASHGSCQTGLSGASGCSEFSPCSGTRGVSNSTSGNYQFYIVSYDANSNQPFNCGEKESIEFYGITLSGDQASAVHTMRILCNNC